MINNQFSKITDKHDWLTSWSSFCCLFYLFNFILYDVKKRRKKLIGLYSPDSSQRWNYENFKWKQIFMIATDLILNVYTHTKYKIKNRKIRK